METFHRCELCGGEIDAKPVLYYWALFCCNEKCPELLYDFVSKTKEEVLRNWNRRFQ